MPKKQPERTPEESAEIDRAYQQAEKALKDWWTQHPQGGTFGTADMPPEAFALATMPRGPYSWKFNEMEGTVVVPPKG